ncbi:MAG: molybdopterin-binding protein [Candidatus Korarchaeota archaeon]|nr:molybdopterin-binding protein [Thermoproteota archaeon]
MLFKRLIPVEEAQNILISHTRRITDVEEVELDNALNRVAASDIYAEVNVPNFDRATLDGYAIIAEDVYNASEGNPVRLLLKGYIKAGTYPRNCLSHNEAFRVDTGAPLPRGANAVVPIEYTSEEEGYVLVFRRVPPWANIQWAGEDIARGEIIVQRGTIITPRHVGALAGTGYHKVKVVRKPRVAVFSIGDELITTGSELSPGKIYDINIHTIASLVRENFGEPVILGIARDSPDSILEKLEAGLKIADIVVSTGGSSVGQADFVRMAAENLGAEILFHGVMSKPGKPVFGSKIGDKLYIGLPGNPTSAIVSFMLYVRQVILKMLGVIPIQRLPAKVKLRRREYGEKGRRLYKAAAIKRLSNEFLYESLPASSESISTLSKADAYFIIGEDVEFLDAGTQLDLTPFDANSQPADIFIIGEFSPTILRTIFSTLGDRYAIRYIKRSHEATIMAIKDGIADIAILRSELEGSIKIIRELAIAGDKSKGDIVTALKDIEGVEVTLVGSHHSAILRYLNNLAAAVVAPKEFLELYGIKDYSIIGYENIFVHVSEDLKEIVKDAIEKLGNI